MDSIHYHETPENYRQEKRIYLFFENQKNYIQNDMKIGWKGDKGKRERWRRMTDRKEPVT